MHKCNFWAALSEKLADSVIQFFLCVWCAETEEFSVKVRYVYGVVSGKINIEN